MTRARLNWPEETLGYRADILDLLDSVIPQIEVCLDQGIIKQRYNIIEILLPSIDESAHEVRKLAKKIYAVYLQQKQEELNGSGGKIKSGRPPKWSELTEEAVACSVGILDCIYEIKLKMRQGNWGSVATSLRICLNLSNEIIEQLQIIESDPVPRAFYEDSDGKLAPSRWRRQG